MGEEDKLSALDDDDLDLDDKAFLQNDKPYSSFFTFADTAIHSLIPSRASASTPA